MIKRKKLIVYTDGSYADGKGGWAFNISCNKNNTVRFIANGSYATKGSAQCETNACIEALNFLPEIEDEQFIDIEVIEIRSDFLGLVKFINNYQNPKFESKLKYGHYACYTNELLELLKSIKKLPVEIQAKKVNKKDIELLKVHKLAKYSLLELPNDNEHFYLETSDHGEREIINRKIFLDNAYKELEEFDKQKWFDYIEAEVINLSVNDVIVEEDIHLESHNIRFCGNLKQFKENGLIDKPVSVRKKGDKYILIAGMSRLCAAKLLGLTTIPAVVQDISYLEFILKYVI